MKIGRNDPCPCGSGKKYKKCCLNKEQPPPNVFYARLSEAYNRLEKSLVHFGARLDKGKAMAAAFGEFTLFEEKYSTERSRDAFAQIFMPWFLFNWLYDPELCPVELDVKPFLTVADMFKQKRGRLDSLQERVLNACILRPFSFYEIVSVNPGHGFLLKDVLTRREYEVTEKLGSQGVDVGDILFASIAQVDTICMMVGCSPMLIPPIRKPSIIHLRQHLVKREGKINEETLLDYEEDIRALYFNIYESLTSPPTVLNTDGEPIVLHRLTYEIEDVEKVFNALAPLCETESASELLDHAKKSKSGKIKSVEIPWTRKGHNLSSALENTVLGLITIEGRRLTIEVNSKERAEKIKNEVDKRLVGQAKYKGTEIASLASYMEEAKKRTKASGTKGEIDPMDIPEVKAKMKELVSAHWDQWLKQKIPALGGKTPRQAVKEPDGRESVEAILLDARRGAMKNDKIGDFELACIEEVEKKLGLDKPLNETYSPSEREKEALAEIIGLVKKFFRARSELPSTYLDLTLNLCEAVSHNPYLNLSRGRREIWAAGIMYAIAELNFLFDPQGPVYLSPDEICSGFGVKKTTAYNKALMIRREMALEVGDERFCAPDIIEMFSFLPKKRKSTPVRGEGRQDTSLPGKGKGVESVDNIYQLKVTLKGIQPPIWRRIQVPSNYTFWDLHVAIQDAMGWFDGHLHCFDVVDPRTGVRQEIGIPDENGLDFGNIILPGWKKRISEYISQGNPKLTYVYDFGDDWQHEVKLEKVLPAQKGVTYPTCIGGKRACPPEDCGGIWRYQELLSIISDPNHEQYADVLEELGEDFDPEAFDPSEVFFDDPRERWEMVFGRDWEEGQEDECEELGPMRDLEEEDELERLMEVQTRTSMLELLLKAKKNELQGLSEEEKRIARVMLEHEEEYFGPEHAMDLVKGDFDPDTGVNPFLHVIVHSVAEEQLKKKDPKEVAKFYQAMRGRGLSHHDTIHLIGQVLLPLLVSCMQRSEPFDQKRYKKLLNEFKRHDPEEIPALIGREFDVYPI